MEAKDKHAFSPFPGGRSPQSCIKCGLPPSAEVHQVFEVTAVYKPVHSHPRRVAYVQETLDVGTA